MWVSVHNLYCTKIKNNHTPKKGRRLHLMMISLQLSVLFINNFLLFIYSNLGSFRANTVISTFTAPVDHSQVHLSYEHISW